MSLRVLAGCRSGWSALALVAGSIAPYSSADPRWSTRPPWSASSVLPTKQVVSVSTYTPKASEIQRAWHVVDAEGLILGRMASEVAAILRGKHKPTFTPHMDTGDHVVIINADKVVLTGAKLTDKHVYDHSGYPGGLRTRIYGEVLVSKPEEAVRRTIRGMLPKNRLGRQQITKLKVYSGADHPHSAQQPQPLTLDNARALRA